jgi:FtsZ-binding cell division protein ZapB
MLFGYRMFQMTAIHPMYRFPCRHHTQEGCLMTSRNPQASVAAQIRSTFMKRILAGGLAACSLVSGSAFAFGSIVFDPTKYYKDVYEYGKQLERWNATANHYRQQLISMGGLSFGSSKLRSQGDRLLEVDPNYGLEDACRKRNDGGMLGSLTSLFKPDANAEILNQQLEICMLIVRAENKKYNETVNFINGLQGRQLELQMLKTRRDSVGNRQGDLAGNDNDFLRYQQYAKMDMDNWQAMIAAYDGYIAQLNKYQQRLAQRALRGKQPDIITTIVQGAVLKKVLDDKKNEN